MATSNDAFDRGINTFRGTKDYFGAEAIKRQSVIRIIQDVFEMFGFEPLQTPAIENDRTLRGKYGDEGEMKRFHLSLPFPQESGLRYDHTVPLARFMAMNWNRFPLPYRRYVIGPVWRNETAAAGRLREFTQCDFDTVGSSSPIIDAEVVAINYTVLDKLNFGDLYTITLNDRRFLDALTLSLNLSEEGKNLLYRAWDNIEKKEWSSILYEIGNPEDKDGEPLPKPESEILQKIDSITKILLGVEKFSNDEKISILSQQFKNEPLILEELNRLGNLMSLIRTFNVPEERFSFNPLLARGLSYYTGPIFETIPANDKGSSITGGGRFDKLIENLGGPDLPASGSSFGLERVMGLMDTLGITAPSSSKPKIFITIFDFSDLEFTKRSLNLASKLRIDNIAAEVYNSDIKRVGKQIDIAQRKGYRYVAIIGPEEIATSTVAIKDLSTSQQVLVNENEVASFLLNNPK